MTSPLTLLQPTGEFFNDNLWHLVTLTRDMQKVYFVHCWQVLADFAVLYLTDDPSAKLYVT